MGDNGAGAPPPPRMPMADGRGRGRVPVGYKVQNDMIGATFGRIFDTNRPKPYMTADEINRSYGKMQKEIIVELDNQLDKMFVILRQRNNKIHDMVENLKNNFIDNPESNSNKITLTNEKVKKVRRDLTNLTVEIDKDIKALVTVPDNVKRDYNIFKGTYKGESIAGLNFLDPRIAPNRDNRLLVDGIKIGNMDDRAVAIDPNSYAKREDGYPVDDAGNLDITNPAHKNILETRLKNCYILEHLYLKKHGELMNVFAFSLNMYEKYMIALNLLMFLIKYLVKYNANVDVKQGTYDTDCKIKIPKKVITNIGALIDDQKKVQDTLKKISKHNEISRADLMRRDIGGEVQLDTSLGANEPAATDPPPQ